MYYINIMLDVDIMQEETNGKRGRPKVARPMKRVNISVEPGDYEAVEPGDRQRLGRRW